MTNLAQNFTGFLFYGYDGIHQVGTLAFDNYQTCTVPLSEDGLIQGGRIFHIVLEQMPDHLG